jgi:hypothetical protein
MSGCIQRRRRRGGRAQQRIATHALAKFIIIAPDDSGANEEPRTRRSRNSRARERADRHTERASEWSARGAAAELLV